MTRAGALAAAAVVHAEACARYAEAAAAAEQLRLMTRDDTPDHRVLDVRDMLRQRAEAAAARMRDAALALESAIEDAR